MKFQVLLRFILLDNRIIINNVRNQTYTLQASKHWQIQVNCFLNLRYEFKYPMTVNITKYDDILFYTFIGQAVNHSSPYAGFSLPSIIKHVLSTFGFIYNRDKYTTLLDTKKGNIFQLLPHIYTGGNFVHIV